MYVPLRLPPSNRDFRVFREVQILGNSTWETAERHHISQTRVRQIVQHVKRWLADQLPEESEEDQAKEVRLARHLAAERLQWLYCDAMTNWNHTHDPKYLRYTVRVATAMARLGIVAGKLEEVMAVHEDGIDEEEGTRVRGQGSGDRGQETQGRMTNDRVPMTNEGSGQLPVASDQPEAALADAAGFQSDAAGYQSEICNPQSAITSSPPDGDFSGNGESREVRKRREAFMSELRLQMGGGYILPPVPAVDADEETIRDWLALLTEHARALSDAAAEPKAEGGEAVAEVRVGPGEPVTMT